MTRRPKILETVELCSECETKLREAVSARARESIARAQAEGTRSGLKVGNPGYIWTPEVLAQLRALVAGGMSPQRISTQRALIVARRRLDKKTGKVVSVPGTPCANVLRRRLADAVTTQGEREQPP